MVQEPTRQQRQPARVGMSLPRQDGPDKVTGRARYAGDQVVPGMLYARLRMELPSWTSITIRCLWSLILRLPCDQSRLWLALAMRSRS